LRTSPAAAPTPISISRRFGSHVTCLKYSLS
jgi:hypothetical protein